jgi:hypothetical protein
VLTYSNWETGTICQSESFASLSEGLQNALGELGGVPLLHRTDRMTAAINNLTEQADFQKNYQTLLRHYGLEGRKIQTGQPNENGDVEQRHYRLRRALDQALLLRGSRDFAAVEAYGVFLRNLFEQLNGGRRPRLVEEMERLRPLPDRRLDTAKRVRARVNSGSLIVVERNSYSVNSRLIGEIVEARVFPDRLEIWYGDRRWSSYRACAAAPTIALITATSSTGWYISLVRLQAIATVSMFFRAAASAWLTTCSRRSCLAAVTGGICRSWNLPRKRGKLRWRMRSDCCWQASAANRRSPIKKGSSRF